MSPNEGCPQRPPTQVPHQPGILQVLAAVLELDGISLRHGSPSIQAIEFPEGIIELDHSHDHKHFVSSIDQSHIDLAFHLFRSFMDSVDASIECQAVLLEEKRDLTLLIWGDQIHSSFTVALSQAPTSL